MPFQTKNIDREDYDPDEEKPEQKLFNADANCDHVIIELWSGIKCAKCHGWFCY